MQGNRHPDDPETRDKLSYLLSINDIIGKLSGIRETNHLMETLIAEIIAHTEADQGIISLISKEAADGLSTVVRFQDESRDSLPHTTVSQLLGWIYKNGTYLKIDNLDADNRFAGLDSRGGRYKRVLCYPLVVRSETIGLITLVRSERKPPFEDRHRHMLGILAPQSAQILANAKLIEDLTRANELLEMSRRKLKEENLQLKCDMGAGFAFENIIGKSAGMKKALSLVSRYCASDSPILITGETGTGKELIAKAIHCNGNRRNKPFVVINCGLKTESLLESELFGHMKGSFTGAIRNKIGLFKEADGGTVFLDEIGDAPLSTQAAVLRVIQNGEIRPIGSTKTETVNVRVISATNRNLAKQISSGAFREDLFYRLSTFSIELPPLRERREDIPLLINHFINLANIKLNKDRLSISREAMDPLVQFDWPGNIRELESEIERAAVTCGPNGVIGIRDLSPNLVQAVSPITMTGPSKGRLRTLVEKMERELIVKALAENRGNVQAASRALGLSRRGIANKISRYRIVIPDKDSISDK